MVLTKPLCSWVRRGNVISGNTFERVRNTDGMSLGYPQVRSVYYSLYWYKRTHTGATPWSVCATRAR
jgi:hypothetical protein